jgi:uroporphyrinogen decarboxylase
MNSKEIVRRAVEMDAPPRIPFLFLNKDIEKSDIMMTGYAETADFQWRGTTRSEWSYEWLRIDDTMGQPHIHPLTSWDKLDGFIPPDSNALGRYDPMAEFIRQNTDKYLIGGLGITGFNLVTFLRGFENVMEDIILERKKLEKLFDQVVAFENGVIRNYGRFALDAVAFGDDWGTQRALMISPRMWREIFKPRYREQFALVHELGFHVYFHSCGYVVDIFNFNQPDLLGVERLGKEFGGQACFCCPVDHQTVAIQGTRAEIFDYVKKLADNLGCFNGGFIGYIEEYHSVGMSDENYRSIVEAFEGLNA